MKIVIKGSPEGGTTIHVDDVELTKRILSYEATLETGALSGITLEFTPTAADAKIVADAVSATPEVPIGESAGEVQLESSGASPAHGVAAPANNSGG